MNFKCGVCGATPTLRKTPKAGFAMVAYDNCIEWPWSEDEVPTDREAGWMRLSTPPKVGDVHTVKATFPFNFEIGEEFWTLFMPALSYLNGWEYKPEEIPQSALVKCRVESIIEEKLKYAWIEVRVQDVMMLSDIPDRLPAVSYDEQVDWTIAEFEDRLKYENWTYYDWNAQGDLGGWSLIYTDEAGVHHLILYAQWDFHEDTIYCGNIIVEPCELEKFQYSDQIKKHYEMLGEKIEVLQ